MDNRFQLGHIVFTPYGYGQVVATGPRYMVWVFGEGVMAFDVSALRREQSPAKGHHGIDLVGRQAALLSRQAAEIETLKKQLRKAALYQQAMERDFRRQLGDLRGAPVSDLNDDETQGDE